MLNSIKKRHLLLVILIIIAIVVAGFWLLNQTKLFGEKETAKEPLTQQPLVTPEKVGAGEIGEIYEKDEKTGEKKPIVSPTLPPAIFSTAGKILEVKEDRIIVKGDGYNFADRVQRDLIIIFTEKTITFSKNQLINWQGQEGLSHLGQGMEILISSQNNIRGKTQFEVKTVNILQ